jgi:hypothetical protein
VPSDEAKITRRSSLVIGAWETRPSIVAMNRLLILVFELRSACARLRASIIGRKTYGVLTWKGVFENDFSASGCV